MAMNKGRQLKLLKGEKLMYFVIVFLVAAIPLLNVYTSAMVTRTNIEVESLKTDIEKQKEENEILKKAAAFLADVGRK